MTATQLRDYRIVAGAMDEWVAEWRARIVPIRRSVGFTIAGAWVVEEESRFVWLLSHPDGWDAFEAADAAYFASPERASLDPDPARFIDEQRNARLREIDLP
jgi:NIPSNAP protein